MAYSIRGLRDELVQIRTLLSQGSLFSFSPEERQALLADSQKYVHKLDTLADEYLTVGLLGGTGVGKSSLMNALAGSDIASTSHRRPHTDRVLIYRHLAAELPPSLLNLTVPWREITHEANSIRQILLCDLPDFDSLLGEHRQRVLRFLEYLDVLVWVASPEKYADERFYAFLRQVPKAKQNFYFVLNKADLLFGEQNLETGYAQLAKATASFHHHLEKNGIHHPLIYGVSAVEAAQSRSNSPWNQFSSFRNQIFQHRDVKEIMAIKAANLDVEVQQLLALLEKELLNLGALRQILREFVQALEDEREEWKKTGHEVFQLWLETRFKKEAYRRLADPRSLVGPAYVFALLVQEWHRWVKADDEGSSAAFRFPGEGTTASLRHRLELLQHELANRLMRSGLPATFLSRLEAMTNPDRKWENLVNRLQNFLEIRLASPGMPAFYGFRGMQYATYLLLFVCLLLAVGGESAWLGLLEQPGWSGATRLMASMIHNLFSPGGLAALGTYALLHVFFGLRHYSRYRKLLQRRAQKFIQSLSLELEKMWEEELDAIASALTDHDRELEAQMVAISGLREKRKGD